MNNNFKIVLSGHSMSNRCKCINCHYNIVDIYSNRNISIKKQKEVITPEFRQVIKEKFSKGKLFS
jgi:hypothetical protein